MGRTLGLFNSRFIQYPSFFKHKDTLFVVVLLLQVWVGVTSHTKVLRVASEEKGEGSQKVFLALAGFQIPSA